MKDLEFFRNVTVGQYLESDSPVHHLTPATKFFAITMFFFALFANTGVAGTLLLGLLVALAALAARVNPLSLLRSVIPALPFLGFIALLTLVFQQAKEESSVLVTLGPWQLHSAALLAIALLFLRFTAVVMGIGLLTSVTSEREIAHGVEDSLRPLGRLGFPAHEFALIIAIALRFVPIVAGELEGIVRAQASRGGDFGSSGINPLRKARAYLPLFVPLIIRTLERAEILIEAMEARCWVGAGRTRYATYKKARGEDLIRAGIVLFTIADMAFGLTFGRRLP